MSEETGRMSSEDKFLGVRTTITDPNNDLDDAEQEVVDEIEVNVVDDAPEEDQGRSVASYDHGSEVRETKQSAKERINELTAKFHSERRAKDKAKRLSDEAVNYTQNLQTENQRLLKLVNNSQSALTEQSQYGADAAVAIATENYKKAHESGDAGQIATAQQALTQAQMYQASAPTVSQQVVDHWKQEMAVEDREMQRAYQDQVVAPNEPEPEAMDWQQKNPWFGEHKEMTSTAFGVHETLVDEEGIDPSHPEYYARIDKRMREIYPSYFGDNDTGRSDGSMGVETASRRKASTVVAPAARNSGAMPRRMTLTSTEVSLAGRLGLTPQQYAASKMQLLKENA